MSILCRGNSYSEVIAGTPQIKRFLQKLRNNQSISLVLNSRIKHFKMEETRIKGVKIYESD